MNMRAKLIIAFALTVILPVLVISIISVTQTHSRSTENFIYKTQQEIRQIDNGFQLFFKQVKNNALFLSNNKLVKQMPANTQNYLGPEKMIDPHNDSPAEGAIFDLYTEFGKAHEELLYVYMGTENGGFIQYPAEPLGGYDPRERPWYKLAKNNPNSPMITSAYQGVTGGPMVSAVSVIKNHADQLIGVQSMDVTLTTLTNILSGIRLGKTGYLMLIDETNTILADAKNSKNNFKKVNQLASPLFAELAKHQQDTNFHTNHQGREIVVTTYTSKELGWRFVGIIDKSEILAPVYNMAVTIIIIALLMMAIFVAVSILLANRIVLPISKVADGLRDIAKGKGDLTRRLDVTGKDEISQLAQWFNQFLDSIEHLVVDIKTRAITLNESASYSSQLIGEIKSASHKQEVSITKASDITGKLTLTSKDVTEDCQSTLDSVLVTDDHTEQGNQIISTTVNEVTELSQSLTESAKDMHLLEQESENITKILDVIRAIAEQTNLLALNAAIEAARAGEQGRGFAVVADEVRSLAQRSRESTEEIDSVLNNLIQQNRQVSQKMHACAERSKQTLEQTERAHLSFDQIRMSIEQIKAKVAHIAAAADQQNSSADELNSNISGINDSAKGIASSSDSLAAGSDDLLILSAELNDLVGRFKVDKNIS
ncbi:methyl-accepting chemotaxis protein [Paraglaciecola aestuariivivens]